MAIPAEFEFQAEFRRNRNHNLAGTTAKFLFPRIPRIAWIPGDSIWNTWGTVKNSSIPISRIAMVRLMGHNSTVGSKMRPLFAVATERDLFLKMSLQFVIGISNFYTFLAGGRVVHQTLEYLNMLARGIFIFPMDIIFSQMLDFLLAICS